VAGKIVFEITYNVLLGVILTRATVTIYGKGQKSVVASTMKFGCFLHLNTQYSIMRRPKIAEIHRIRSVLSAVDHGTCIYHCAPKLSQELGNPFVIFL